jgi:hypothetical protein
MSIKHRIGRLEEEAGQERCENCLPWGDTPRISHHYPDGTTNDPSWPPERCSKCGYEPFTIIIEHTHVAARM